MPNVVIEPPPDFVPLAHPRRMPHLPSQKGETPTCFGPISPTDVHSTLVQVKCDERQGTCLNCERILLTCKWPLARDVVDRRETAGEVSEQGRQSQEMSQEPAEPSSDPGEPVPIYLHPAAAESTSPIRTTDQAGRLRRVQDFECEMRNEPASKSFRSIVSQPPPPCTSSEPSEQSSARL